METNIFRIIYTKSIIYIFLNGYYVYLFDKNANTYISKLIVILQIKNNIILYSLLLLNTHFTIKAQ